MKNIRALALLTLSTLISTVFGVTAQAANTSDLKSSSVGAYKEELEKSFTVGGKPIDPLVIYELVNNLASPKSNPPAMDALAGPTPYTKGNFLFGKARADSDGFVFEWQSPPSEPDHTSFLFGYKYLGKTSNGLHIIKSWENDGGSGTFYRLLAIEIIVDYEYGEDGTRQPRLLLVRRAAFVLGDRYDGNITIQGAKVIASTDSRNLTTAKTFTFK